MQNYELLLILPGTLSEDEVNPLVDKVKAVVEDGGGEGLTMESNEKRRLAYPIQHIRYGYFYLAFFKAEESVVGDIRKKLGLMPELLRVLLKKHDPEKSTNRKIDFGSTIQSGFGAPAQQKEAPKEVHKKEVEPKEEAPKEEVHKKEEEPKKEAPKEEVVVEKPKAPVSRLDAEKKKVDLEEIDKKLDEILDIDLSI